MSFLSGIVRAAGALIGGQLGGPAGAAIGGGLATKLTGGSTKDALGVGAISGIGAWALPKVSDWMGGGSESGPDFMPALGNENAPVIVGTPTAGGAAEPGFMSRLIPSMDSSTLAKIGIGGALAAGSLAGGPPEQQANSRPAGSGYDYGRYSARPISRTRRDYLGDYSRYGEADGEHRFFDVVNPEAEITQYRRGGRVKRRGIGCYAEGGYVSPSGEMVGYGSDDGSKDTGKGTVSSFGDFAKAALQGLSMMGPLGFVSGMLGAEARGVPGLARDVRDGVTSMVDRGRNALNDPLGHLSGAYDGVNFDGRESSARAGERGYGDDTRGMPSTTPDTPSTPDSPDGPSAGGDPGAGGGPSGPWKKGGHVRGLAGLTAPSPAARMGSIRGPGSGQSDEIPAMLSDGEHVIDAEMVAQIGDGSNEEGHRRLEAMKRRIRAHKRSASNSNIPPKTKGLGAYMKAA